MKKLLYVLILILLSVACKGALVEKPYAISSGVFYSTAAELEAGLYAAYDYIRASSLCISNVNNGQVDYAEGRVTFTRYSNFDGELLIDTRVPEGWQFHYVAILRANIIIEKAPKASGATQEEKDGFVAEARFIRGLMYLNMVRNWGGVPLRTVENQTEPDVPRSSEAEVFDLIVSDLKYAEDHLPETPKMLGRATKYSAKTALTDAYMWLGRWADASAKALEVINSGKFSLVPVSVPDDFYNIFGPLVSTSSEEIFYYKCNLNRSLQIVGYRHHPSVNYYRTPGQGSYAKYTDSESNRVIKEWDSNDLRKDFNLYFCDIGFGPTTMLFKKFIDPTTIGAARNDWPIYRYTDVLLMYAEASCRANNGPVADGVEKLNMIHRRAYGYDPNAASPVDFKSSDYNTNTFVDLVLKEALYEQMDEAKRFWNLKRTGKLKEAVQYARGIDASDTDLYWPIPANEFLYNGAIDPVKDQNPGY